MKEAEISPEKKKTGRSLSRVNARTAPAPTPAETEALFASHVVINTMRKKQLSEAMSHLAKIRHKKMSPEEKTKMGKKMVEARIKKLSTSKKKSILP